MEAHELKPPAGSRHKRKRVGRGNASGHGTYSGRGMKGQKARSGGGVRLGFEGGQTPLIKRLPHRRGFTNIFRVEYIPVSVGQLERFEAGTEVTPELLRQVGIIKNMRQPVKVLGDGQISKALTVRVQKFSATAKEKIEAAGGSAEEVAHAGRSRR
jgi:large subunit ribosomal protein L15